MSQALDTEARDAETRARCPMTDLVMQGGDRAPMAGFAELDALRHSGPAHTMTNGEIIYTRYEEVLAVAQDSDVFFSKSYDPLTGEESAFVLVPQAIDGPMHVKWRRILASTFAPGAISSLDDSIRDRVNELIDGFIDSGSCDFIKDFSLRFPTSIFLKHIIGLPVEELDKFIAWESDILHPKDIDPMVAYGKSVQAQTEVVAYFEQIIAERRKLAPEDRADDLISRGLSWKIDGELISDSDLLSFYLLVFEAGLDTVTAELGYGFHHLATHPADRDRIVNDPAVIPTAVEELLRVYAIVNISRTAMSDTEVDGCPIKAGQRVVLSLPSTGRDEGQFPDATTVDLDRKNISHLAFGAGPHRCLGSHLARHELAIAYEEWHKRIPVYTVAAGTDFDESRSSMMGLNSLPLSWDPATRIGGLCYVCYVCLSAVPALVERADVLAAEGSAGDDGELGPVESRGEDATGGAGTLSELVEVREVDLRRSKQAVSVEVVHLAQRGHEGGPRGACARGLETRDQRAHGDVGLLLSEGRRAGNSRRGQVGRELLGGRGAGLDGRAHGGELIALRGSDRGTGLQQVAAVAGRQQE
jgi:cytochrome P450